MDLLLTVVRPGPGPEVREDALVSVGEGATVADLARALDERAGAGAQQRPHPSLPHSRGAAPPPPSDGSGTAAGAGRAGGGVVVDLRSGGAGGSDGGGGLNDADGPPGVGEGRVPDLWVGDALLDPGARLDEGAVLDGAVIGLGGPVAGAGEPGGLVELRLVGGPGAGAVHRLGLGEYTIGGAGCDVEVSGVSGAVARVSVGVGGEARVEALGGAQGLEAPARPVRRRVLPGPLVLGRGGAGQEDDSGDGEGADESWWARRRRRRLERRERRRERRRLRRGEGARAVLPEHVELDPDARRGLVELDRRGLEGCARWPEETVLSVGDVQLMVGPVPDADAVVTPTAGAPSVDFNRPPRLARPERPTVFTLPREPRDMRRPPFSPVMLLAPVVMGGVMFFVTHRVASLVFLAFSPIMMIANRLAGRANSKKMFRQAMARYEQQKHDAETAAFKALVAERGLRRRDHPDPAEVMLRATGPRAGLWERRVSDGDWLDLRVGTADVPSEVELSVPERASYEEPLRWTAPDVPVSVPLGTLGVVGVAGPGRRGTARWMVSQCAVLHSPAELSLMVLVDPAIAGEAGRWWEWVCWLPHARVPDGGGARVRAAVDEESIARLVGALGALIDQREQEGGAAGERMVVVLDGARALRLVPGMASALRRGPRAGVMFVCIDADRVALPEECRSVVMADEPLATVARTGADEVEQVVLDAPPPGWAERVARALAPVRDASAQGTEGAIPRSSRLLDLIGLEDPDAETVLSRWRGGARTTRAIIGEDAEGPFALDVRADGPHALVAGTTGSGKSELLQTLIAALCVGNTPQAMTFVLVDYKGGAAFKDCARLPHTVGMVTDLDGHLTSRALESLGAELRRREHQLARAGAKDIEDYVAAMGPGDEPMPRLMLIIDEFAALVAELPQFVTGLVDIARRGRSLGVHLVLATQRPAGVVSAEIKSNTNLRIALRVTDESDSQDVVESSASAHIPPSIPGRAHARLGHGRLMQFQASRVGGRPHGAVRTVGPRLEPLTLEALSRSAPAGAMIEEDVSIPTDLARLVDSMIGAHQRSGAPRPHRPWLEPLPDLITLDQLDPDPASAGRATADGAGAGMDAGRGGEAGPDAAGRVEAAVGPERADGAGAPAASAGPDEDDDRVAGSLPPLLIGLEDVPGEQAQRPMTWDYTRAGHLGVAGAPRSGRSAFLRTLAVQIARTASPREVHLYGLDAGSGALGPLVSLPHTGAVVTRDQSDRIRRLLDMLGAETARRQQALALEGYSSLAEQRAAAPTEERLPYLVVLIDRWDAFTTVYETQDSGKLITQVENLLREGAAAGVRVVLTGDRTSFRGRMGMALEDRLVLRMPSPDHFDLVGMRARDVPVSMPPGRAFRSGTRPREVHLALLDADPAGTAQRAAFYQRARAAATRWGQIPREARPARVDELPMVIDAPQALALGPAVPPGHLALGIGGDTLSVRTIDMEDIGNGVLIYGPRRSGRSTALAFALDTALQTGARAILILPRRSPLTAWAHHPGVAGVLDATATVDQLTKLLNNDDNKNNDTLVIIDDLDILGKDHKLAAAVSSYMQTCRDHSGGVLIACNLDEVQGYGQNLLTSVRRNRTGVLLAPRESTDGERLHTPLPRSVGGPVPLGRGVMITTTGWSWIQVPRTAGPAPVVGGGIREGEQSGGG